MASFVAASVATGLRYDGEVDCGNCARVSLIAGRFSFFSGSRRRAHLEQRQVGSFGESGRAGSTQEMWDVRRHMEQRTILMLSLLLSGVEEATVGLAGVGGAG